jgi:hypothetical protein
MKNEIIHLIKMESKLETIVNDIIKFNSSRLDKFHLYYSFISGHSTVGNYHSEPNLTYEFLSYLVTYSNYEYASMRLKKEIDNFRCILSDWYDINDNNIRAFGRSLIRIMLNNYYDVSNKRYKKYFGERSEIIFLMYITKCIPISVFRFWLLYNTRRPIKFDIWNTFCDIH